MKTLKINQIRQLLPHRYPMLLVDRVLDWEAGKKITAIKNVTVNEDFFNGPSKCMPQNTYNCIRVSCPSRKS